MSYHFIGLGGIGMSALARILLQKGEKVQGSDSSQSALLESLKKEGAKVHVGHSVEAIQAATTVIYSSSIQEDNVEMLWAKEKKLSLMHRSELLDELMKDKKKLLVTGTHGKTTTSALLAFVLEKAGLDPSFVIGGLIRSLNTNAKFGKGDYFVAEADESDGSFLKTAADLAIITNLENEHLEFWGSARALDLGFCQFIAQTKRLIWCRDDERLASLKPQGISYGFSENADYPITNFGQTDRGVIFDLKNHCKIELNLLGRHNALNAAAVFALALELNIEEAKIRVAFKEFSGTARRLEFKGEKLKLTVYDDYAHHPSEISATLQALRAHIKERRLIAIFQPHRYSRVRDLFEEWVGCFDEADEIFITDIYSAGEKPISGITSAALYTKMREKLGPKVHYLPRTHLESGVALALRPLDVAITLGAGDVTGAGGLILDLYAQRGPKLTVGVLFGGVSAEHRVSIMSAKNILKGLDTSVYEIKTFGITLEGEWTIGFDLEKKSVAPRICAEVLQELSKCDVCIPVFHGPFCEDGMIAAVLDALFIPYVGCDYRSGAICMHKAWTKYVALNHNVPSAPFFEMSAQVYKKNPEKLLQEIEEKLGFPVWIKSVHLGSSIGVSRAASAKEVAQCAELALHYDDVMIIEKEVEGRQIEFALLGNEHIRFAEPAEIINHGAFVAYDKKYGGAAMEIKAPADISETEKKIGYELAERVYRGCGCKGLARVDFFLDKDGYFWFNEINPFPGFTDTSAYPLMWRASKMTIQRLVDEMLALALQRTRALSGIRGRA